jgi:hypothetical protein
MPVLYVYNKIDSLWIEELDILDQLENVVPSTCCFVVGSCCVVWLILYFVPCRCSQFGTQMESRRAHGRDMGKVQHAAHLHKGESSLYLMQQQ